MGVGVQPDELHAVAQHSQDQHARDEPPHLAFAALEADAAQHGRSHGGELGARPRRRGGGARASKEHDRPRANNQGRPALDDLFGEGCKLTPLFGRLRVVLAGRSADDDAVNFGLDQAFKDVRKSLAVDLSIRGKGRHSWSVDAFEFHVVSPLALFTARSGGRDNV